MSMEKPLRQRHRAIRHIVEVRHIGKNLAAAMTELRAWLDDRRIEPEVFEHSVGGPGITFRVHFIEEADAHAFAETFHGWISSGGQPDSERCWVIDPSAISPSAKAD